MNCERFGSHENNDNNNTSECLALILGRTEALFEFLLEFILFLNFNYFSINNCK
jgi:hypothetical protein